MSRRGSPDSTAACAQMRYPIWLLTIVYLLDTLRVASVLDTHVPTFDHSHVRRPIDWPHWLPQALRSLKQWHAGPRSDSFRNRPNTQQYPTCAVISAAGRPMCAVRHRTMMSKTPPLLFALFAGTVRAFTGHRVSHVSLGICDDGANGRTMRVCTESFAGFRRVIRRAR